MDNKQIVKDALENPAHDFIQQSKTWVRCEDMRAKGIKALTHLTDTEALKVKLEGMREEDSPAPSVVAPRFNHPSTPSHEEYYRRLARNILIDTFIKEIGE